MFEVVSELCLITASFVRLFVWFDLKGNISKRGTVWNELPLRL